MAEWGQWRWSVPSQGRLRAPLGAGVVLTPLALAYRPPEGMRRCAARPMDGRVGLPSWKRGLATARPIHRRPCPVVPRCRGCSTSGAVVCRPSGLPAIRRSSSRRSTLVTDVATKPSVTHDPRCHPAADRGVMPLVEPGAASLAMDAAIGSRHDRERNDQGSAPLAEPGAASVAMDTAVGSRDHEKSACGGGPWSSPRTTGAKPRHDTAPRLHLRGAPPTNTGASTQCEGPSFLRLDRGKPDGHGQAGARNARRSSPAALGVTPGLGRSLRRADRP